MRNSFRFNRAERLFPNTRIDEVDESTGDLSRFFLLSENLQENYSLQTNIVGEFATGSLEHTLLFGVDLFRFTELPSPSSTDDGSAPSINIFDPELGQVPFPERDELPFVVNLNTRNDNLGIYLQDQIAIGEQWNFLAGGRFDIANQQSTGTSNFFDPADTQQQTEAFSPRLGVVYQPIEPLSLYGSFSQSFTPNNALDEDGELIEPVRGTQFEAGIKGELFDGDLFATLAAFNINQTNIAIADPVLDNVSRAIGEQRSRGIELDVIGEILPGWNIITSYAYTDTEVTEDDGSETEGNRFQGVPENAVSLWTTYEIQSGNLQGLGFGAGLFFVGEREGDIDNTFQVPSYTRTDASIFYNQDKWRAAINVRNLFDIDYIESTTQGRFGSNPGAPLAVLGSFSIEF